MRVLISALLSLLLTCEIAAQCTTFAGTSPNFQFEFCQGEFVFFNPSADMVNDGNDVIMYTIHLGTAWNEDVVSVVLTNTFPFSSSLNPETPYHVSLVMGNPSNGGTWFVDENDPCLSVINMGTILVHETPTLNCSAQGLVCGEPGWQINCLNEQPGYTYSWQNPSGQLVSTVAEPIFTEEGDYCVTITTAFGCSAVECVDVLFDPFVPEADAYLANPNLCEDTFRVHGYPIVNGPPLTYEWTTNGGQILQDNIGHVVATGDGEYCIILTNLNNNCKDTACVDVVVLGTPPIADAGPVTMISCPENEVQIGGPGTSIGPDFVYEWSCFGCLNDIPAVPNPIVSEPGSYGFSVTDTTTGCQAFADTYVESMLFFQVNAGAAVCPGDSLTVMATTFSNNPPFNIVVSEGGTTLYTFNNVPNTFLFKVPVLAPTVFDISVSDAAGCEIHREAAVTFDSLEIDFIVEADGCHPVTVTASFVSNTPNTSFLMNWNTGDFGSKIPVTNTGWYIINVLDNYGCEFIDSVYVTVDYAGLCAYIDGTVHWDTINNCALDMGEPTLAGWLVKAIGNQTYYGTTDANGNYFIPVEPGIYTVTLTPPNLLWEVCQNTVTVSLPNADDAATVDFLAYHVPECPLLNVDISTPQLRRCFGGNYYNISYCNGGTGPATAAYVVVEFDEYLTLDFSSIPYTDLGNNIYQFNVGDIAIWECGSFWTSMTVSCDAVLGETHCTEAHIYPDTSCLETDPLWSGASLELNVVCDDSVRFTVTNVGTAAMTNALNYVVIEDIVMYMQAPPPSITLAASESYTVAVPANGATWRMEVTQEQFHPQPSYPAVALEGCGTNVFGTISTGYVNLFPLGDSELAVDLDCTENIGGCDPNGKYAYPTGVGSDHLLEQNKDIEYIIRFQNTGTDTAFNVVIKDTISEYLDVASIRPGASSHPYQFETYSTGVIKFSFPNIELPDSTENEPASNGYVTYRISQKPNVLLGTIINNSAAIYFDFNEPVITNTIFHTIGKDFIISDANENHAVNGQIKVSPNPAGNYAIFEMTGDLPRNAHFKLIDGLGRQVLDAPVDGNIYRFERKDLMAGVYYYSVVDEALRVYYTGKILLK